MFKSGAGVEVIENKHYMAARVFLPWEFVVSNFLNISLIFRTFISKSELTQQFMILSDSFLEYDKRFDG